MIGGQEYERGVNFECGFVDVHANARDQRHDVETGRCEVRRGCWRHWVRLVDPMITRLHTWGFPFSWIYLMCAVCRVPCAVRVPCASCLVPRAWPWDNWRAAD